MNAEREAARSIARGAGAILRGHFRRQLHVEYKGWADHVTVADRESEEYIRDQLRAQFRADAIWGEEFGRLHGSSGRQWVVDPLDGTANYAGSTPAYCVCLTLIDQAGRTELCVTYDPNRDELFECWRDGGSWLNGVRLAVNDRPSLEDALIHISIPRTRPEWDRTMTMLRELTAVAPHIRNLGSSALAQAWVAAGRLDAHVKLTSSEFDVTGGNLMIEEAGGIATDLVGSRYVAGGSLLAASASVHPVLLALGLNGAAQLTVSSGRESGETV